MPLNKAALKAAIKAAFDSQSDIDVDPATARDQQAEAIADAIHNYVTEGDVQTTVTGTSVSGGPVTGTGTGKLV